jgi:MFS family permease
MLLFQQHGLAAVMFACIAAPLVAAAVAFLAPKFVSPAGNRLPFLQVVRQIWREGFGLALQGVGLAALTTFASLYFSARGWGHAGWVMSFFGVGFIVTRIAFGQWPDRIGGYRVAFWSFVVEAIGQSMLWLAPNEGVALAGALVTGLGCALIYPALGVEALTRVLPANRGSAMGAFTAFLDIAYGLAGPVAGWVAGHMGYGAVFVLGAACALAGLALVQISRKASRLPPSNPTPNRAAPY